jgi:hypothetical protein
MDTALQYRAHSLENLVEGHNWFLDQFARFLEDESLSASYLFWQKPVLTSHHLRSEAVRHEQEISNAGR